MKQAFKDYFDRTGHASEKDRKRIFELYHAAARFLPGEIADVFLAPGDGTPDPETGEGALWFFSGEYACVARGFRTKDDLEFMHLKGLQGLHLEAEHFDLQGFAARPEGGHTASLTVEFNVPRNGLHRLWALGDNCAQLAAVTLEHLKKNL